MDVETDPGGTPTAYVCHFRQETGDETLAHREIVRWYEPNRGYASVGVEPNFTGQTNSLAMMTLEARGPSTTMTYDMHYDAEALDETKSGTDVALADIAERLIARFGGVLKERYVQR